MLLWSLGYLLFSIINLESAHSTNVFQTDALPTPINHLRMDQISFSAVRIRFETNTFFSHSLEIKRKGSPDDWNYFLPLDPLTQQFENYHVPHREGAGVDLQTYVTHLRPNTTYSVRVSAWNTVGPSRAFIQFTTISKPILRGQYATQLQDPTDCISNYFPIEVTLTLDPRAQRFYVLGIMIYVLNDEDEYEEIAKTVFPVCYRFATNRTCRALDENTFRVRDRVYYGPEHVDWLQTRYFYGLAKYYNHWWSITEVAYSKKFYFPPMCTTAQAHTSDQAPVMSLSIGTFVLASLTSATLGIQLKT